MKVLIITHDLKPSSGWGRYSLEVVNGLKRFGYEVRVLALDNKVSLKEFAMGLIKTIRAARETDVLHALDGWPYGVYGYIGALIFNKKLFITGIGTYSVPAGGAIKTFLMQRVYHRANKIFAISRYTARKISEKVPNSRVGVVHMGLTLMERPSDEEVKDYLHKTNLSHAQPLILTVGEIKNRKGQLDTLQAFKIFHDKHPDAAYVMVGKSDDKNYRKKLESFIADNGLNASVRIITDITDDKSLAALYSSAGVLALNSRNDRRHFEGFGLVILEAGQFGTPAIGSLESGVEDAIEQGVNGYLNSQGDIEGIAESLERALCLDRARVAEFARKFSWEDTVREYSEAYTMIDGMGNK